MSIPLRKRSSFLIISTLLVASFAFAVELLLPVSSARPKSTAAPDTSNLYQARVADSIYQSLLASSTELYNQQRYEECLAVMKKALAIKPDASPLKERIIRVEGLIEQQKKTHAEYTRMMRLADDYFEKKDYLNAKASYQVAIDIKPDDALAREKMAKTMELLRSNKAQNILYDVTLASADKLFSEGSYEKARSEYENAGKILPGEAYPKEKINAIIKIMVDQQVREELYQSAITSADQFYTSGNFKRSLMDYKKALEQKPDEPYPKARIDELTKVLADMAALEEAYKQAITLADQLFTEARYPDSRNSYTEALGLKPAESYPAGRIDEIDKILAGIAKTNAEFDRLVNLADSFYLDRNFARARQNYQLALQVKPGESYPKAMLAKTAAGMGQLEADETAKEQSYQVTIARADSLFNTEAMTAAKTEYQHALTIKPGEDYPQKKLADIDSYVAALVARQHEIDTQYKRIIENADRMFSDTMYSQASGQYLAASQLKPEETWPRQRMDEINDILANLQLQKEIDTRYNATLREANKLFVAKTYDPAREEYRKALEIKPSATLPSERIQTIDSILLAMANREADYTAALARGDSLMETMSYRPAKSAFQHALSLKPNEAYPASKLTEIDAILAEQDRMQSLNDQYDRTISQADQLFAGRQWTEAKLSYQKALDLKPGEAYPAGQLTLIGEKLSELARLDALNKEYQEKIAVAERFFTARALDSARVGFLAAQHLKPAEPLPASRIAQIDSLLAAMADQQALDETYRTLITGSDNLLERKEYTGAKAGYNQALALKPTEKYPATKIDEIEAIIAENNRIALREQTYSKMINRGDSLMADSLFIPAQGEFEAALALKPSEEYPKIKLKEIESLLQEIANQKAREIARLQAIDRDYLLAVTRGETLLEGQHYDSARSSFVSAQELKPAEPLPGVKIALIDSILADLAKQKALDEQYASLISETDKLFQNKEYVVAKTGYIRARELKPEEPYPAGKITEIDALLAEKERHAALERQYAGLITRGDSLLAAGSLSPAREEFVSASTLKPAETYPRTKMEEIDQALSEMARLAALEKNFNEEIETADRLFGESSWDPAIAAYNRAKALKPSEGYPDVKLHQIDSIRQEIARQLQIDNEYQATITEADKLFGARSLDPAKAAYVKAGTLRPENGYWQEQIEQIDRILAEQKRVNEQYDAAIAEADARLAEKRYEDSREAYQNASLIKTTESYPREKIKEINKILAEIQGLRQTFDKLVANGDQLFATREYYKAKENFQQALDLFPEESYPKQQLHTINVRIDSIYRANKADYDKAVGEGDGFFNTYEYDKAIDAYTRAITFLPMEDYPRMMIAKIRKTISENAIADVLNQTVVIKAGEEQRFPFDPVNIASRRNNFIYMKVKNLSNNAFNILMRYGKGDQTSGGLAIRNVTTDGEINERLISVKDQDPWYREDNNWISVYPQGGDIEVSFIQVSRAIK